MTLMSRSFPKPHPPETVVMFHCHTLWKLFAVNFFAALSAPVYALTPLHQPIDAFIKALPHAAHRLSRLGDDRLAVVQ